MMMDSESADRHSGLSCGKANQRSLRRRNRPVPSTHPILASEYCQHPVTRLCRKYVIITTTSPAKGDPVSQRLSAASFTSRVHSRTRLRRRACWDTGGPSMTNSKGIGIAVGFSLRLVRISVPYYPPAIVTLQPPRVLPRCPGVPPTAADLGPPQRRPGQPSARLRQVRMRHGVRERHRHLAHGLRGDRPRRRSGARPRRCRTPSHATAGETLQLAGRYAGLALAAAAQILDPVEMSQLGEEIGILDAKPACRIRK